MCTTDAVLLMNDDFGTHTHSMTEKLYKPFKVVQHTKVSSYTSSVTLNEKQWPEFDIHRWPSYGVKAMYNSNLQIP